MSMKDIGRRFQGILTVGVFGTFSVLMWPNSPWIAGFLGSLTVFRLYVLTRKWA
jgi:hypothetical protein